MSMCAKKHDECPTCRCTEPLGVDPAVMLPLQQIADGLPREREAYLQKEIALRVAYIETLEGMLARAMNGLSKRGDITRPMSAQYSWWHDAKELLKGGRER